MTLRIDKFGRVLIPKYLRQIMMIAPGDEIEVEVDPKRPAMMIFPKKAESEYEISYTDWGFPMIKTSGTFPEDFDTVEFIKETREVYLDRKFGRE